MIDYGSYSRQAEIYDPHNMLPIERIVTHLGERR